MVDPRQVKMNVQPDAQLSGAHEMLTGFRWLVHWIVSESRKIAM